MPPPPLYSSDSSPFHFPLARCFPIKQCPWSDIDTTANITAAQYSYVFSKLNNAAHHVSHTNYLPRTWAIPGLSPYSPKGVNRFRHKCPILPPLFPHLVYTQLSFCTQSSLISLHGHHDHHLFIEHLLCSWCFTQIPLILMGMQKSCSYYSHHTDEEFCQGSKKFDDLPMISELLNETEKETESRSVRLQSPVLPAIPSGLTRATALDPGVRLP